jgi:excisionase family DNA binding protein
MSTYSEARPDVGPLIVKPQEARRMLACSNTRLYELLAERELDSFLDGRSRKITVESVHRYITRRLTPTDNSAGTNAQPRSRGRPRKVAQLELPAAQEGRDG